MHFHSNIDIVRCLHRDVLRFYQFTILCTASQELRTQLTSLMTKNRSTLRPDLEYRHYRQNPMLIIVCDIDKKELHTEPLTSIVVTDTKKRGAVLELEIALGTLRDGPNTAVLACATFHASDMVVTIVTTVELAL